MAKTNPIGVRFDIEKLDQVKKEQNLKTPQAVLAWYESLLDKTEEKKTTWIIKEKQKPPEGLTGLALRIWKDNHK